MTSCLAGIRVLDLSQYLPGPFAGQILADLGAEVIKVEPPAGEPMRRFGPIDGDGIAAFYKLVNAGKRVLRLDLKSEDGRESFAALLRGADVLLESFRPGALAKLGFGPEAVTAVNDRLIHCALSGYGQTGPYTDKAGHDLNYLAWSGGLATSGIPERPVPAHPPMADFAGGQQAALAILAALLRRARSGEGAFLDLSIAESVLAWQAVVMTAARRRGHEPARGEALLNGGAACYQVYRTADGGFVTLAALEEKFWASFCGAVDRPDWIERQWEAFPQDALKTELAALFAADKRAAWEDRLAGVDCCFQAVLTPEEAAAHPQVAARGFVEQTDGAEPAVSVAFPLRLDGKRTATRSPFREDTVDAVLARWA